MLYLDEQRQFKVKRAFALKNKKKNKKKEGKRDK
jgi:hypothetical protein